MIKQTELHLQNVHMEHEIRLEHDARAMHLPSPSLVCPNIRKRGGASEVEVHQVKAIFSGGEASREVLLQRKTLHFFACHSSWLFTQKQEPKSRASKKCEQDVSFLAICSFSASDSQE